MELDMMRFQVDPKAKRVVELQLQRRRGGALWKGFRRICTWLPILLPVAFFVYAYWISDGFVYHHDRYGTYGQKNLMLILTVVGTMVVLLLLLRLVVAAVDKGLSGRNTYYRVAETLTAEDGMLIYGYKNFLQSFPKDMVGVKFRLEPPMEVRFDPRDGRLTFTGPISSLYYENYEKRITQGTEKFVQQDFILYDYFSPSLSAFLRSQPTVHYREEKRK